MKTEKYKEYKSFTPMRCRACNTIIDYDIHDSLCEECLGYAFPVEDEDDFDFIERYDQ